MTKKVVCKTMLTFPSLSVPHKIFPNKTHKTILMKINKLRQNDTYIC